MTPAEIKRAGEEERLVAAILEALPHDGTPMDLSDLVWFIRREGGLSCTQATVRRLLVELADSWEKKPLVRLETRGWRRLR